MSTFRWPEGRHYDRGKGLDGQKVRRYSSNAASATTITTAAAAYASSRTHDFVGATAATARSSICGGIAATSSAKKSSVIFCAAPSISRDPICASLPPTCALATYANVVSLLPLGVSVTRASPFMKPAAPPAPSNSSVYVRVGSTSAMRILPAKRAKIGPTFAVSVTRYASTPSASSVSQPGIHARKISGSCNTRHTLSAGAGTLRVPVRFIATSSDKPAAHVGTSPRTLQPAGSDFRDCARGENR